MDAAGAVEVRAGKPAFLETGFGPEIVHVGGHALHESRDLRLQIDVVKIPRLGLVCSFAPFHR